MQAGFFAGLGQAAGGVAKDLVEQNTQRLKSLTGLYQSMATNPELSPEVHQAAYGMAGRAASASPWNLGAAGTLQDTTSLFSNLPPDQPAPTDPYALRSPFQHGLLNHEAQAQNQIALERQKKQADMEAQFDFLKKRFGLLDTGAPNPNETDFDRHMRETIKTHTILGSSAPPPTVTYQPYGQWTDDNGVTQSGPVKNLAGKSFNPEGREITVTGRLVPKTMASQAPSGAMEYVNVPQGTPGPTGIAAPPRSTGTTGSSFTSLDTGQHTSQTQRNLTPILPRTETPGVAPQGPPQPAAGATATPPRTGLPTPPPVAKAAKTATPAVEGPPTVATGDDTTPVPYNVRKSAMGGTETRQVLNGISGMRDLAHLKTLVDDPNNMLGAVGGRVAIALNKLGSEGVFNWVHDAFFGRSEPTPEQQAAFVQSAKQTIENLANDPHTPAAISAETQTLMRAINGIELVAMSGSGNGVTRLYMLLKDVMLNPAQTRQILIGHMRGVAGIFAGKVAPILEAQSKDRNSWNALIPEDRAAFDTFGTGTYFHGYKPSTFGKQPVVQSGPDKGKPLYKHPDGQFYTTPPPPAGGH